RVLDGLPGQIVLQFEGGNRQPIDEQGEIERVRRIIAAVVKLARDREAVGGKPLHRLRVAGRRRAIEEGRLMRPVPDATAQYVDHAALADLALQPRQELLSDRAIVVEVECLDQM